MVVNSRLEALDRTMRSKKPRKLVGRVGRKGEQTSGEQRVWILGVPPEGGYWQTAACSLQRPVGGGGVRACKTRKDEVEDRDHVQVSNI